MKLVRWHWFASGLMTNDKERAVLPTILFARDSAGPASSWALAIGWWAWGVGVIRTKVKE